MLLRALLVLSSVQGPVSAKNKGRECWDSASNLKDHTSVRKLVKRRHIWKERWTSKFLRKGQGPLHPHWCQGLSFYFKCCLSLIQNFNQRNDKEKSVFYKGHSDCNEGWITKRQDWNSKIPSWRCYGNWGRQLMTSGLARECQMDGGSEAHSELSQRERLPLSTWRCRDSRAQCSHFTPTHI